MHGGDGDQAAAADREEFGRGVAVGACDRQQDCRPSAGHRQAKIFGRFGVNSGPDHVRLDAAIGRVARPALRQVEAVRAQFEGHRNG